MSTTFESASVGDRVWSITKGWGEITKILKHSSFPIHVKYDSTGYDTFTFDGYLIEAYIMRSLFWDEVKIEAPKKPMPDLKVDTKVVVWGDDHIKYNRYFAGWCELTGLIMAYDYGATSWSAAGSSTWPNWELGE
jgi:hypothetical protein